MGYIATKQELIAILRRFDMDGDAKISFKEFELGMRSSIGKIGGKGK
jgi:Ca2+-binding EF-hand superfamily protein